MQNKLSIWLPLLLMIFAFSLCACAEPAPELLLNGGFEKGKTETPWNEGKTPYSWFKWSDSWGWAAWKYDAISGIPAHNGNKYLVCGSSSSSEFGLWGQNIIVTEGTSYDFSVWARTEGWHSNPQAILQVDFKNSDDTVILTDTHPIFTGIKPNPNVWAPFSMTTSPAPAGATSANFCLRGDLGSPIFDDASVILEDHGADFNYDKTVNNIDSAKFSGAWLKSLGQGGYEEKYDLDENGDIDLTDLRLFAESWLWYETPVVVNIDEALVYQEMDGFGASFTDSSAWVVHEFLNTTEYLAVMEDLFDPVTGAGLSYLRQPMGTSDMRRRPDYSYNDTAGDYAQAHFSIAKDQDYIIPVLQKALEFNPDIKIMGSPWTAPSWMKSGENAQYQGGWLTNNHLTYNSYADYFVKYVQSYAAEGIPIDAITLQNEPLLIIDYPSMYMSASDQIQLINKLGPEFQAAGIDTKIIAYDHNWDNTSHALSILADPTANSYLDGIAWHHYGGDVSAQTTVHNAYPDKGTYFTEGAIGTWMYEEGDFNSVLIHAADLLIDTTRNWAKCVVLWNMAMHEIGSGPITPGESGCWSCFGVITVDSVSKAVTKNGSYYALGHAAKFVRSGARRINSEDTSSTPVKNVAFVNTDGSIVIFAINKATDVKNFQVNWNGASFIYPLPGRSVTTFTWPDSPDPHVAVWVTTGDKEKLFEQRPSVQFYN